MPSRYSLRAYKTVSIKHCRSQRYRGVKHEGWVRLSAPERILFPVGRAQRSPIWVEYFSIGGLAFHRRWVTDVELSLTRITYWKPTLRFGCPKTWLTVYHTSILAGPTRPGSYLLSLDCWISGTCMVELSWVDGRLNTYAYYHYPGHTWEKSHIRPYQF